MRSYGWDRAQTPECYISLDCPYGGKLLETRTAGGLTVQAGALGRKWEREAGKLEAALFFTVLYQKSATRLDLPRVLKILAECPSKLPGLFSHLQPPSASQRENKCQSVRDPVLTASSCLPGAFG